MVSSRRTSSRSASLAQDKSRGNTRGKTDQGSSHSAKFPPEVGSFTLFRGREKEVVVRSWDEEAVQWAGENLYQVLQSKLSGAHLTAMLQNLEPVTPEDDCDYDSDYGDNRDDDHDDGGWAVKMMGVCGW